VFNKSKADITVLYELGYVIPDSFGHIFNGPMPSYSTCAHHTRIAPNILSIDYHQDIKAHLGAEEGDATLNSLITFAIDHHCDFKKNVCKEDKSKCVLDNIQAADFNTTSMQAANINCQRFNSDEASYAMQGLANRHIGTSRASYWFIPQHPEITPVEAKILANAFIKTGISIDADREQHLAFDTEEDAQWLFQKLLGRDQLKDFIVEELIEEWGFNIYDIVILESFGYKISWEALPKDLFQPAAHDQHQQQVTPSCTYHDLPDYTIM